jgi:hypothetical protein
MRADGYDLLHAMTSSKRMHFGSGETSVSWVLWRSKFSTHQITTHMSRTWFSCCANLKFVPYGIFRCLKNVSQSLELPFVLLEERIGCAKKRGCFLQRNLQEIIILDFWSRRLLLVQVVFFCKKEDIKQNQDDILEIDVRRRWSLSGIKSPRGLRAVKVPAYIFSRDCHASVRPVTCGEPNTKCSCWNSLIPSMPCTVMVWTLRR